MAERKLSNRERIKEITAGIEQEIRELFESDKYREYLITMSRFPSYSVNNTLLIHMQMPDATLVASYGRWQKQFGRHVKKGEHGITIIAPTPYRKKIEEQKLDPETKAPLLDKDGKVITEEKEINVSMYKPVKVFDVRQTEGKPLPQLASDLTGDVRQFDAFMEALRRASPVPMRFEKMDEKMDGYFNYESQSIAIREGMSEVQTVSAAVHEMAHAILHNYEKQRQEASAGMEGKEPPKQKDRRTEEVEAEGISFVVCSFFHIDTAANSIGYLGAWSKGRELAELKASLETINKTAGSLIKSIDGHFKEICKERGIDLSVKEQTEKDPVVEFAAELDQLFYDYDTYGYQDSVENREDGIDQIVQSILKHDVEAISDWLADVIEEADEEFAPKAKELSERLDALVAGKEAPEVTAGQKPEGKETDILTEGKSKEKGEDIPPEGESSVEKTGIPMAEESRVKEADIPEEQVDGAEKRDTAIEQEQEAKKSGSLAGEESQFQNAKAYVAVQVDVLDQPKQTLDEYPLPDTGLRMEDLEAAGYRDGDMLPISKDRAGELFDKDLTVYAVVDGGSAEMIFEKEELDSPEAGSLFAVSREDWEGSAEFHAKVMERQEHQEEREQAFLSHEGDCFAIYQVRGDTVDRIRFMGLEWLKEKGIPVERTDYDLVYTGELTSPGDTGQTLENLYEHFNLHHPADYHSPSLSVSDIIAVKQNGVLSCHYCDRIGFQEIPGFLPGENYLKAAEMAVEDDYGMIDGIINNGLKEQPTVAELERQAKSGQPISLMDLADAVHREQEGKKKSVVEQLKSRPDQRQKKTTQKQRDGREI